MITDLKGDTLLLASEGIKRKPPKVLSWRGSGDLPAAPAKAQSPVPKTSNGDCIFPSESESPFLPPRKPRRGQGSWSDVARRVSRTRKVDHSGLPAICLALPKHGQAPPPHLALREAWGTWPSGVRLALFGCSWPGFPLPSRRKIRAKSMTVRTWKDPGTSEACLPLVIFVSAGHVRVHGSDTEN